MMKKTILKKLQSSQNVKLVNYDSRNWYDHVLVLWVSKDKKDYIVLDLEKLEWSYRIGN